MDKVSWSALQPDNVRETITLREDGSRRIKREATSELHRWFTPEEDHAPPADEEARLEAVKQFHEIRARRLGAAFKVLQEQLLNEARLVPRWAERFEWSDETCGEAPGGETPAADISTLRLLAYRTKHHQAELKKLDEQISNLPHRLAAKQAKEIAAARRRGEEEGRQRRATREAKKVLAVRIDDATPAEIEAAAGPVRVGEDGRFLPMTD